MTDEKLKNPEYQSKKPLQKIDALDLVKLVRIASKDIRGDKKTYRGLCEINGVSWAFSNAMCRLLKLDKNKKIQDLNEQEIKSIENMIVNCEGIPEFLKNRRKDRDSGEDKHLYGSDLDLQQEFDIKRMKKIKCYKGVRHSQGQPVRGQRTKSHFRKNKKTSGKIKTSAPKAMPSKAAAAPAKAGAKK